MRICSFRLIVDQIKLSKNLTITLHSPLATVQLVHRPSDLLNKCMGKSRVHSVYFVHLTVEPLDATDAARNRHTGLNISESVVKPCLCNLGRQVD